MATGRLATQQSQRWALITGASSGLGALFAERLAAQGFALLLTGRDEARLATVQAEIRRRTPGVVTELVIADLGTGDGQDDLLRRLAGRPVAVLVNNAGVGSHGRFADADAERESVIVEVNVLALQRITHAVLAGMVARRSGRILNVASSIGFQPGPYQAVYAATKAYVLSFSQALATEIHDTGVTVTALCPGPTETGFVSALGSDVSKVTVYRRLAQPGPVVDQGLRGMFKGKLIVIPGLRNRILAWSTRITPAVLLNRITASMLRAPDQPPAAVSPTPIAAAVS